MKKHVEEKRNTAKQKLCIYCNGVFSDTKFFNKHLQEVHWLPPVTRIQNIESKLHQASAFGGTVRKYVLESNCDHDFLQFMLDRKELLDEIIDEAFQAELTKAAISKSQIGKACLRNWTGH